MKKTIRILGVFMLLLFVAFFAYGCKQQLKISLDTNEVVLATGAEIQVDVISKITGDITWATEDESVATVVDGKIVAVSEGETFIIVSSGGNKIRIKVTVGEVFTITWLNYNEEVLEIDENVLKGTLPSYDGETPKRGDYTFIGWDPEVVEVTEDATYIAQFSGVRVLKATWKNWDGTLLYVDHQVEYDTTPRFKGNAPTRESDDYYDYMFIGWSPALGPIKANTTYTAQFAGIKKIFKVT